MNKISNFFIASAANNYRPAVLSAKAFLIYGLLMLILRLLFGILPAQGSAVESQTLMDLINAERSSRNLTTLVTHSSLITAASQKSQDMISRDYFAHVDPDGNYVWGKITAAGYGTYKILGENLAVDFLTAEGMIKAWIDSPTHRANLLHNDFLEQGLVALYGDFQGQYTNLTTSLFGARIAGSLQPAPTPAPEPPIAPPAVRAETVKPAPQAPKPQPASSPISQPQPKPIPQPVRHTETSKIFEKPSAASVSRIIFTLLGLALLMILSIDTVIIYKHEAVIARSHSSYHLFNLMLIVLISILIWWW